MNDDARAYIRLALIPGLGPLTAESLISEVEKPSDIFSLSMSQLTRFPGVGTERARKICDPQSEEIFEKEVALCNQQKIRIISRADEDYPKALLNLSDPPLAIWMKGSIERRDQLAISIVGPRRPSAYGHRQAQLLATGLARIGTTIISGLARGIDTIAHQSALKVDGRTIAVLGSGFGNLYPDENAGLADEIINGHGAVISEFPYATKPHAGNFPRRNRIVAAFGLASLVIEAGKRSGSLITARLAGEMGKDVLALPGPIDRPESQGSNQLIRDGASCITKLDDILDEIAPLRTLSGSESESTDQNHPRVLALNKRERDIYSLLSSQARSIDDLVRVTDLPISAISTTLMSLELRRLAKKDAGGYVVNA